MERIKKALIVFASPHKMGKTGEVFAVIKEKFGTDVVWYNIDAYEKNAKPCIDCGRCMETGNCVFYDLEDLDYYLGVCDLVVFAFPVYNYSFPAPLKSIIDRMQRYYRFKKNIGISRFEKKEKIGIVLMTAGSEKFDKSIVSAQIEPVLKLLNIIDINYIILKGTDDKKLNIDNFLLKSENSIEGIVDRLKNKT